MNKRYPEFDFQRMQDDYELLERYDKAGEHNYEEHEPKKDIIQIDLIDEDAYIPFLNAVDVENARFKKRTNYYQLDMHRALCDYFCKLMIYSFAVASEKLTPSHLYKGNKNHKYNLINTGRYTGWKGPFMESGFINNFGISEKQYQVKGVGELLNHTSICLLLLYDYFLGISDVSDIPNSTWIVIKKILRSFDESKKYINLDDSEKDSICVLIFGTSIDRDVPKYIQMRNRKKNMKPECILSNAEQKNLMEELKNRGKELSEEYFNEDMSELFEGERYGFSDGRQVSFAEYLAPIMAAICEFFCEDTFFSDINIWTQGKGLRKIPSGWFDESEGEKIDEKCLEYSKNYGIAKKYVDYKKRVVQLCSQKDFLYKFYYLFYLMLFKIHRKSVINEEYRFIQYYSIEQIMKWELIQVETDIIYKYVQENCVDADAFIKEHRDLKFILKKLSIFDGAILRIKLAENVLKEYFDDLKVHTSSECLGWKKYTKKLEYSQLISDMQERAFLDVILDDGRNGMNQRYEGIKRGALKDRIFPLAEKKEETYLDKTTSYLELYVGIMTDFQCKGWRDGSREHTFNLKSYVKDKVEELDPAKKEIQKWVIYCNFSGSKYSCIKVID